MFNGRHFDRSVILLCVRWYLAYNLSLRDLEEMMAERGLNVDHSTIHRWVVHFSPQLLERFNRHKRSVTGKWHMDETYIKVRGKWMYLYRAIDSLGDTVEFFFSANRDLPAAKRLLFAASATTALFGCIRAWRPSSQLPSRSFVRSRCRKQDRAPWTCRLAVNRVLPHFVWSRGSIRAFSNSGPARPYIARLRVLRRLIWPSACPLLQGSSMALLTASMSLRRTRANRMIGMSSESIASSIHASSGGDLLPRRMPLKRIARRRISTNASDPCFRASTFLACRSVSRPRGLIHSAAATTGEIA